MVAVLAPAAFLSDPATHLGMGNCHRHSRFGYLHVWAGHMIAGRGCCDVLLTTFLRSSCEQRQGFFTRNRTLGVIRASVEFAGRDPCREELFCSPSLSFSPTPSKPLSARSGSTAAS